MSVYDLDNFAGRVNLAAAYISQGRDVSCNRTFDTCFEMYDGDVVAAALYRRAEKNQKLAANLPRYISQNLREETIARYAHIPTRKLAEEAARVRAEEKAKAAVQVAAWQAAAQAGQ